MSPKASNSVAQQRPSLGEAQRQTQNCSSSTVRHLRMALGYWLAYRYCHLTSISLAERCMNGMLWTALPTPMMKTVPPYLADCEALVKPLFWQTSQTTHVDRSPNTALDTRTLKRHRRLLSEKRHNLLGLSLRKPVRLKRQVTCIYLNLPEHLDPAQPKASEHLAQVSSRTRVESRSDLK